MLVPLHLNHKSPAGASACQPVIHSLLEWVGVERRRRKQENVCHCWDWECEGVGGQSGWTGKAGTWDELSRREDGRDGEGVWTLNGKVVHCAWESPVSTYTSVYPVWLCSVIMDVSLCNPVWTQDEMQKWTLSSPSMCSHKCMQSGGVAPRPVA